MFSEILKIIPKLDEKDLAAMQKNLQGRFTKIAKKFGGGLMDIIKGGGILGIATTLIDKVLNPLKEVQESIERTLQKGDDLSTYAKQFSTSIGNLARLQAVGKATGLDEEGVRTLLGKFQSSVSTAAQNPGEITSVSAFVGRKDMAEAFFEFIQSMQKLTDVQRNLVQQEVFGEKQILKASSFLNADMPNLLRRIGGPTEQELSMAGGKIGGLKSMQDVLTAKRELQDLKDKADRMDGSNIVQMARGTDVDLARENKRLGNFDDLKKISMATDKLVKILEDGYLKLAPLLGEGLPALISYAEGMATAAKASRSLKGMAPGNGKDN